MKSAMERYNEERAQALTEARLQYPGVQEQYLNALALKRTGSPRWARKRVGKEYVTTVGVLDSSGVKARIYSVDLFQTIIGKKRYRDFGNGTLTISATLETVNDYASPIASVTLTFEDDFVIGVESTPTTNRLELDMLNAINRQLFGEITSKGETIPHANLMRMTATQLISRWNKIESFGKSQAHLRMLDIRTQGENLVSFDAVKVGKRGPRRYIVIAADVEFDVQARNETEADEKVTLAAVERLSSGEITVDELLAVNAAIKAGNAQYTRIG